MNATDERILFEQVRHCLGAPYTGGPGQTAPLSAALDENYVNNHSKLLTVSSVQTVKTVLVKIFTQKISQSETDLLKP